MAADTSTLSAALKEFYLPAIREQLNQKTKFLAQIERGSEQVEGKQAHISVHVERNGRGVGSRAEGETLPTAANQTYDTVDVDLFYHYGQFLISGQIVRAAKSDRGSWLRAAESESRGLTNDARRDVNRQLWGTSNGVIATCDTTSGSTEVELLTTTTATQMRQFEVGMYVDIGTLAELNAGSGGPVYASKITAVTRTIDGNQSITISDSVSTVASTDFVARAGSGGSSATTQRELTGVQTIVNDASGAVHGIDVDTYEIWKSKVLSNSSVNRAPTDELFEEAIDEIDLAGGPLDDIQAWTSPAVRRVVAAQLKAQKRFNGTTDIRGGFKGLDMDVGDDSVAVVKERDVPDNKAYVLDTACFKFHEASDWEFMDDDHGNVLQRVANKDQYQGTLFKYAELCTDQRNAHGRIDDLSNS